MNCWTVWRQAAALPPAVARVIHHAAIRLHHIVTHPRYHLARHAYIWHRPTRHAIVWTASVACAGTGVIIAAPPLLARFTPAGAAPVPLVVPEPSSLLVLIPALLAILIIRHYRPVARIGVG